jgi:hypothetical protein
MLLCVMHISVLNIYEIYLDLKYGFIILRNFPTFCTDHTYDLWRKS